MPPLSLAACSSLPPEGVAPPADWQSQIRGRNWPNGRAAACTLAAPVLLSQCGRSRGKRIPVFKPIGAAGLALPESRRSAPSGGSDQRSGGAWGLVPIPVFAMHMLVRDFFVGRLAHANYF